MCLKNPTLLNILDRENHKMTGNCITSPNKKKRETCRIAAMCCKIVKPGSLRNIPNFRDFVENF